jgi:hypothetical protein
MDISNTGRACLHVPLLHYTHARTHPPTFINLLLKQWLHVTQSNELSSTQEANIMEV